MKIVKILGIIVLIGLVLFALIQLVPTGADTRTRRWCKSRTGMPRRVPLPRKACFDCHSNEML